MLTVILYIDSHNNNARANFYEEAKALAKCEELLDEGALYISCFTTAAKREDYVYHFSFDCR